MISPSNSDKYVIGISDMSKHIMYRNDVCWKTDFEKPSIF